MFPKFLFVGFDPIFVKHVSKSMVSGLLVVKNGFLVKNDPSYTSRELLRTNFSRFPVRFQAEPVRKKNVVFVKTIKMDPQIVKTASKRAGTIPWGKVVVLVLRARVPSYIRDMVPQELPI